jgi:CubicO group peptidase (beta-lactamase class C family)
MLLNEDTLRQNRRTRPTQSKINLIFIAVITFAFCTDCSYMQPQDGNTNLDFAQENHPDFVALANRLDSVRQVLKIPGMSAAVVRDQELVWASGFGYADLETQTAAAPDTPYGLASVTKPIAAVLIMQLVEQGAINLDVPVSQYGVDAGDRGVTVRHLLTHTSEGKPGTTHAYNGDRYALLGGVIEGATRKSFAELLSKNILLPLDMKSTALNPISSWGAASSKPIEDFMLMSGLGAGYQHFPDVYSRLAQPYQFDQDFNIIPGKYHTHHNPAAGLISSAADLAKFDIALDQGELLEDTTIKEMFAPAFSTYRSRQDLMYGLGWYAQDFEGLRLNWHSGRWPPSTSALYLKVPEMNLTFIVLANTDNLTVPFKGIGNGDVSQSALAQSFFHYLVYPELLGKSLPEIEWSVSDQELVQQLSKVDNAEARRFLERELWSFRQVYASVGRYDQADTLLEVNLRVYPHSNFRRDELYTSLAGDFHLVPPSMPASSFVWLSWGTAAWILMITISIGIMAPRMFKAENISRYGKIIWLGATLVLGPIALLLQAITTQSRSSKTLTNWQLALRASVLCMTGYTIAWIPALTLLMSLGTEPHPLAILGTTYMIPFLVGLCLVRIPLQAHHPGERFKRELKRSILAEVITFNLGFAILFSLTWLFSSQVLTAIPRATSPFFWVMLSLIAVVGVVLLLPLQYWMIRRGCRAPSDQASNTAKLTLLPTLRASWAALLATLLIMIAALAATVSMVA